MRLGPIFVPGTAPCWECWQWRRVHAVRARDRERAVLAFYDVDTHPSPAGWVDALSWMAAAVVAERLCVPSEELLEAGSIWDMSFASRSVTRSICFGIHGCPRCGLQVPTSTRSFAALEASMRQMWSDPFLAKETVSGKLKGSL